jgi:AraC-like DNA-binding protein
LPRPPLSAFVETFWLYEGDAPAHARERRLPDGTMALVINLRHDLIRIYDRHSPDRFRDHRGSVISGAHATYSLLDTPSTASVLGVQFKPDGAAAFLPLPAVELRGQVLEVETAEGRVRALECWLLARLVPSWAAHAAVAFALDAFQHAPSTPTISAVTQRIGIGQTRFIQVFRDAVGLMPKQFCRIQRFQRALRALESGAPVRWGELAAACGYFDQAHLIHEFRAFSGLTPGAYLASRGAHRNHVPLLD